MYSQTTVRKSDGRLFEWRAGNAAYHPERRPTVRKPKYTGRNRLCGKYWEKPRPNGGAAKKDATLGPLGRGHSCTVLGRRWSPSSEALRALLYGIVILCVKYTCVISKVYSDVFAIHRKKRISYISEVEYSHVL